MTRAAITTSAARRRRGCDVERRHSGRNKTGAQNIPGTRGGIRPAQARPARPAEKPRKVMISLRLESSTVEAYKAAGRGYQTRMAAVLKKHAK
jgi:hypothetical protein